MMRLVLDIGAQKTGSKARQGFFAQQLGRLTGVRAIYPLAGRAGAWHRPLHEALQGGEPALLDAIVAEAEAGQAELVILSYEAMHQLGAREVARIAEAFDDVTAVVFLRRQDQFVNSFHNQTYKAHRFTFAAIQAFERGMTAPNPACDYKEVLERWTTVLGRDRVLPIVYDKSRSVVRAFFDRLGLAVDYTDYVEAHPNTAINGFGISVLRWVKQMARDEEELPHLVTEAHRVLKDCFIEHSSTVDRYSLSFDTRQRIMAHYRESNEWVRQHFFPDRDTLFPALEPGLFEPVYNMGPWLDRLDAVPGAGYKHRSR